jgi:DNA-binding transcriptional MocR family regulator
MLLAIVHAIDKLSAPHIIVMPQPVKPRVSVVHRRRPRKAMSWSPRALASDGPVYLAIADMIAEDIASGRLRAGTRLPPQRELARRLGIDFTTVTRAYAEARRRGLVAGHVGRGTFVLGDDGNAGIGARLMPTGGVDLSINIPPESAIAEAARALGGTMGEIGGDGAFGALLRYQQNVGRDDHRESGARWVAATYGGAVLPERVVVCGGAQHALTTLLATLANTTGDERPLVLTEALTYPGFKAIADLLGLRLVGLAVDEEGLLPAAFRAACRKLRPRLLYCTPTLQNPTTAVMSESRLRQIARIAREFGVAIIEDDVYGPLHAAAPPSLASHAPELTYYVASLSKTLAPGLRVAYVVAPNAGEADRVAHGVRATTWMANPLTAEIATRWIQNGTATRILAAGRAETIERQRVTRAVLGEAGIQFRAPLGAMHAWVKLSATWRSDRFARELRRMGVIVMPADAFAVGSYAGPPAARISVTAAPSIDHLRKALEQIATLATQSGRPRRAVAAI